MPKISSNKITRIHLTLFESKYNQLSQIARENKTTNSKLIRILIDSFLKNYLNNKEEAEEDLELEKNPSKSNHLELNF